jgi:hypothetical protein
MKEHIDLAKKCLKIGREMGHRMEILDIGGGFPIIDYLNEEFLS